MSEEETLHRIETERTLARAKQVTKELRDRLSELDQLLEMLDNQGGLHAPRQRLP